MYFYQYKKATYDNVDVHSGAENKWELSKLVF